MITQGYVFDTQELLDEALARFAVSPVEGVVQVSEYSEADEGYILQIEYAGLEFVTFAEGLADIVRA